MTICIAAISEEKKIVAVTDKMLTISKPLTTTFEITDSNKVSKLTKKSLALFAGDVIFANEILKLTRSKIITAPPASTLDVANHVKDAFFECWDTIVSNYLKMRYKMDLQTFMQSQRSLDELLVKQVNDLVSKFSIDVQILVAGIDENDDSPHIYYIGNEGSVVEQTSLGYACIGSGAQHAILSLIESEYNASFNPAQSLYSLLEAKRRAEYDPGVGENCDIAIVDGEFEKHNENKLKGILDVFDKSRTEVKNKKQESYPKIKEVLDAK